MNKAEGKTVDLVDYLIELSYKWKTIAGITVLVMIVMAAAFVMKDLHGAKGGSSSGETLSAEALEEEEKVMAEAARNALSAVEAGEVENVYGRYSSYARFREFSQKELQNYDSLYAKADEDLIMKTGSYVVSSTIEGADEQFTASALDIVDYSEIAGVLGEDSPAAAYKYVYFDSGKEDAINLSNHEDASKQSPSQTMITVNVIGGDQAACDRVWTIVDNAFQKREEALQKIDRDLKLSFIDASYSGDVRNYIVSKKQEAYDRGQRLDASITQLKVNYIDKFSDDQSTYFNLLKDPEKALISHGVAVTPAMQAGEGAKRSGISVVKPLAIGAVLGLIISLIYILIRYLSSGTMNTDVELQEYYQIPVLGSFFVSDGTRRSLFPKQVKKILGADSLNAETKAALIAPDIRGVIKSADDEFSLYTVQTWEGAADEEIAAVIHKAVSDYDPACQSHYGFPLSSVEKVQLLMRQKNVLLLVHNKKTMQADVEKILDICSRHSINILGAVTLTDI